MGNHELYLAKRNEWKNLSNFFDTSSNELRSYREICNDKWRVIFLDTYAVNVIEFSPDEIQGSENMNDNEFLPRRYTDLTFEAESDSIHSAPNHESQDFFRGFHL